jgi:hypothetical protein
MPIEIADLEVMEQIIRICQSRAAFQPGEMSSVGLLYNKISETLLANSKKNQAAAEAAAVVPSAPVAPVAPVTQPQRLPTIPEESKHM